jgi:hypothetical protein
MSEGFLDGVVFGMSFLLGGGIFLTGRTGVTGFSPRGRRMRIVYPVLLVLPVLS